VDLAEIVRWRPVPGAGLLLTLTERCPMRCAHCSTASTMTGRSPEADGLLRFVGSFERRDRPELIMMTGGEPLLRPELVTELARTARQAGTRSAVLTGAFFASRPAVPPRIDRAVRAVDHCSVSVDAYHERQVGRSDVFRWLRRLLDAGVAVSLHVVADSPDDPYPAGLARDTRRALGRHVPMLVNQIRPVGRAAGWATAQPTTSDGGVAPCAMAAWPVVAADGAILACCHQDTVDRRPVPDHLLLGHLRTDDWPTVRHRSTASPVLRLVRAAGPVHLLARFDPRRATPAGVGGATYCQTCRRLGEHPDALARARAFAGGPTGALLDRYAAETQQAAGPRAFLRRHGCGRYAHLVETEAAS
jgi:pyruvate-formate lyase-activating enzyme